MYEINKSALTESDDNFTLWVPAEVIEKAGTDGKTERILRGIASTEDVDADNEVVVQEGLDLSYLKSHGFINWDHGSGPGDYIGEPVKADVTKAGLYLEGKLYDTPKALEAYNLAKTLERNSTGRRLGWSIQGAVKERDNGRVVKAAVHHVALTPQPKNSKTFAELAKSFGTRSTAESTAEITAGTTNSMTPDLSVIPLIKSETTGADGSHTVEYHPIAFVTQRAVPLSKALSAGATTDAVAMIGGPALGRESLEGAEHAKKPKKKRARAEKSLTREEAHTIIKSMFPAATEELCDRLLETASQL